MDGMNLNSLLTRWSYDLVWYNFSSHDRADIMILYVQIGCRSYDIVLYNFSLAFEVTFLYRTVRVRTCDYMLECRSVNWYYFSFISLRLRLSRDSH
jgi:hypothetical protein